MSDPLPADAEIDEAALVARVRANRSLPEATSLALNMVRLAIDDLQSPRFTRRRKERTLAVVEAAIRDLKDGLRNSITAATDDLSKDLLRALGPAFTVAEMEGARSILELMLAALPAKNRVGQAAAHERPRFPTGAFHWCSSRASGSLGSVSRWRSGDCCGSGEP